MKWKEETEEYSQDSARESFQPHTLQCSILSNAPSIKLVIVYILPSGWLIHLYSGDRERRQSIIFPLPTDPQTYPHPDDPVSQRLLCWVLLSFSFDFVLLSKIIPHPASHLTYQAKHQCVHMKCITHSPLVHCMINRLL